MYAVVANGIQTICTTKSQLDLILTIYQYPKFQKFNDKEAAYEWLRKNTRNFCSDSLVKYGNTSVLGYVTATYKIKDNSIYYEFDTNRVGFLKIQAQEGVSVQNSIGKSYAYVENIALRDELITHHIIAIKRLLKILGDYVDVDITIPDMSIYLATTKYKGKNYVIKSLQKDISQRLGGVSFTIRRDYGKFNTISESKLLGSDSTVKEE